MPFIPNKKEDTFLNTHCQSQEHNPPNMMLFPPEGGTWICPLCGKETIINPRANS